MKSTLKTASALIAALLLVCLAAGVSFSQVLPNAPLPDPDAIPSENPDEPEPPKEITSIEYRDGKLTVELLNAEFQKVLNNIGQKAGFTIEGHSEAFSKKITTRFQNIELERAVTRLLTLVSEKNYLVNYSPGGGISSLEIYGIAGPPKTTTKPTPTTRPMPTRRTTLPPTPSGAPQQPVSAAPKPLPAESQAQPAGPLPPSDAPPPAIVETPRPAETTRPPISRRMRFVRPQRTAPPQPGSPDQPAQDAADAPPPPDTPDPTPHEETPQEVPYIPQKAPVFVPSRAR